jgi:hypothetical protein
MNKGVVRRTHVCAVASLFAVPAFYAGASHRLQAAKVFSVVDGRKSPAGLLHSIPVLGCLQSI